MKTVPLESLKGDWINLLQKISPEIESQAAKVVLCSFNPRWTCATFALGLDDVSSSEFPNFDDYEFTFEFDEGTEPLNVIYSASEMDGDFEVSFNGVVIKADLGDHLFNRPVISLTSLWTHEFLTKKHRMVSRLFFTDSDRLYPCVLPSPSDHEFWDPVAFCNDDENDAYLEKIFGASS